MKRIQRLLLLLSSILILMGLMSCDKNQERKEKDTITIYLNNISYLSNYAPYIQSQFPELDLHFTVGRTGISFLDFLQKNNDLPDIIMLGSVSAHDSLKLNPYLLDLSLTETAASYHSSYLEQYRCEDQSIRWLPVGGVINGILANKDLFDQYRIPLPTDYAGFVAACDAFAQHGIQGYTSDYKYDYTCLYTMEGCSIPELTSLEGSTWRYNYTNGLTPELDKELWLKILENTEQFIHDTHLTPEDISRGYSMTRKDLEEKKLAMLRGTTGDIISYSDCGNMIMLPYFGESADDNWLLTTPAFHIALNGSLAKKEDRQTKVLEILDTMVSQEALKLLEEDYLYLHSFHQDGMSDLPAELENLHSELMSNHLFILQSGTELYSAATTAVQGLITGEFTIETAYLAANEMMHFQKEQEQQEEVVFSCQQEYSSTFLPKEGNPAASAIANTLRTVAGTDILLAPSYISTGSLYASDYTLEQLDNMFMASGNRLYTCQLTGAQIRELARIFVEGNEKLLDPFSRETLPIASGVTLTVREIERDYLLQDVLIAGQPIDNNKTYSLGLVDLPDRIQLLTEAALGTGIFETFESSGDVYARTLWVEYLTAGNPMDSPTPYIILE